MKTTITILGDLYPRSIKELPTLPDNDFCVANLECAITNSEAKIKKDGPNLKITPGEAKIITQLGVDFVSLANNHVLDYGQDGLSDTIEFLQKNKIEYCGLRDESHGSIQVINNFRVGFYCVSEHQYNSFDSFGVNVLTKHKCLKEISDLKKKCDYLIVLFHGGKEYYRFPTPIQEETCHDFVDSGADFVVCQHSHCVGCSELYKGACIVYGQGNFAFPYSEKSHFKTGVIISLILDKSKDVSIDFIPIVHIEKDVVRMANDKEKAEILEGFNLRTSQFKENGSKILYEQYIKKEGLDFLYHLLNKSKLYVRLDTSRLFKNRMLKKYIRKHENKMLYLYNYFNCETHQEYIKSLISFSLKKDEK